MNVGKWSSASATVEQLLHMKSWEFLKLSRIPEHLLCTRLGTQDKTPPFPLKRLMIYDRFQLFGTLPLYNMWLKSDVMQSIIPLLVASTISMIIPGFTVTKHQFFYDFMPKNAKKTGGVFKLFFFKKKIFYDFHNIQFITAIYHCCINMYHIFHKKGIPQKTKNNRLFRHYLEMQYKAV